MVGTTIGSNIRTRTSSPRRLERRQQPIAQRVPAVTEIAVATMPI